MRESCRDEIGEKDGRPLAGVAYVSTRSSTAYPLCPRASALHRPSHSIDCAQKSRILFRRCSKRGSAHSGERQKGSAALQTMSSLHQAARQSAMQHSWRSHLAHDREANYTNVCFSAHSANGVGSSSEQGLLHRRSAGHFRKRRKAGARSDTDTMHTLQMYVALTKRYQASVQQLVVDDSSDGMVRSESTGQWRCSSEDSSGVLPCKRASTITTTSRQLDIHDRDLE